VDVAALVTGIISIVFGIIAVGLAIMIPTIFAKYQHPDIKAQLWIVDDAGSLMMGRIQNLPITNRFARCVPRNAAQITVKLNIVPKNLREQNHIIKPMVWPFEVRNIWWGGICSKLVELPASETDAKTNIASVVDSKVKVADAEGNYTVDLPPDEYLIQMWVNADGKIIVADGTFKINSQAPFIEQIA
jgi:hypothetical protein